MTIIRSACSLLILVAFLLSVAGPAQANPRYAALVIDADSGQVLHASNANATRYPASLTKVMTLYLTFEALRNGKLTLDSELPVSKKAASMPQTNLSLRAGDRIKVRDAIKALVVRSANDVAVVVAESLGQTEWGFGLKMTKKARELGMNSSVFRNASGLPDSKQYTTARDLSVLAVAIKKHFPEYFHFFKTASFTYKGRTYHSHNHAMKYINGADGLKTGFINASGFNLITTVQRHGRNLVGVVMGGRSGGSRDAHMRDLIERSYAKLHEVNPPLQFAGTIPLPKSRPDANGAVQLAKVTTVETTRIIPAEPVVTDAVAPAPASIPAPAPAVVATPVVTEAPVADAAIPLRAVPHAKPVALAQVEPEAPIQQGAAPAPLRAPREMRGQFQPVAYQLPAAPSLARSWGIQVGAYRHADEAMAAAQHAAQLAPQESAGSRIMVSDGVESAGQVIHRARLANMQEEQARRACQRLITHNTSCFVFRSRDDADSL